MKTPKRNLEIYSFDNLDDLTSDLSEKISLMLSEKLITRKKYNLVLPGGNTPKSLFYKLSKKRVDWRSVNIFNCDERCLEYSDESRHDKAIYEILMQNESKDANFYPILNPSGNFSSSIEELKTYTKNINKSPYIVVLGLGEDGHVASIFDEVKNIDVLLNSEDALHHVISKKRGEERVSLSLPYILRADEINIICSGEGKLDAIINALKGGDSVLMKIISRSVNKVKIYWSK